jgi:hypothetical protein
VLLGIFWGTHWELREFFMNTLGTWKKSNIPSLLIPPINRKLQTLEFEIQKPSTQFFGTCNLSKVWNSKPSTQLFGSCNISEIIA